MPAVMAAHADANRPAFDTRSSHEGHARKRLTGRADNGELLTVVVAALHVQMLPGGRAFEHRLVVTFAGANRATRAERYD